jgi:hypothetical protein
MESCVADVMYGYIGGTGVTAGAHRLWTHRSYKAKLPLRIILAGLYLINGMVNTIACAVGKLHFSQLNCMAWQKIRRALHI